MPIGSLLTGASSIASAFGGGPSGPSMTEIAPTVNAINSAPFAVGRGARASAPQPGVSGREPVLNNAAAGGFTGPLLLVGVAAAALLLRRS